MMSLFSSSMAAFWDRSSHCQYNSAFYMFTYRITESWVQYFLCGVCKTIPAWYLSSIWLNLFSLHSVKSHRSTDRAQLWNTYRGYLGASTRVCSHAVQFWVTDKQYCSKWLWSLTGCIRITFLLLWTISEQTALSLQRKSKIWDLSLEDLRFEEKTGIWDLRFG